MARPLGGRRRIEATALPGWIKPQLTKLVDRPPDGPEWLHEIKFDGYRMHARLDRGTVRLLTRTGLDWTHKYPAIAAAVGSLPAKEGYLDGELCGVRPDGTTSFSLIQNASDTGNGGALVFFLFDLLHLDGEALGARPLQERKERLRVVLSGKGSPLHFSDHQIGRGQAFYDHACALKAEGTVSKRADAALSKAERDLARLVQALLDGVPASAVREKMAELEARRDALRGRLAASEDSGIRLHPNMAGYYRAQIADLRTALTETGRHMQAAEIVRKLLDRIELSPVIRSGRKTLSVSLYGRLAGILTMATKAKAPLDECDAPVKVTKLVAGVGFEPISGDQAV